VKQLDKARRDLAALELKLADADRSIRSLGFDLDREASRRGEAQLERDQLRKSVEHLKELLHHAEIAKAQLQGQLDRIREVEGHQRHPVTSTTTVVTGPAADRPKNYASGGWIAGEGRACADVPKHFTSL
jgi:chromosome segregation ATPase